MHVSHTRDTKLNKPRALLPQLLVDPKGVWVDAGSGDGVFTQAFFELSNNGLSIISLDISHQVLQRFKKAVIPGNGRAFAIQAELYADLPFANVNGILLANVLHFFDHPEQVKLLGRCANSLQPDGSLLVVEYNTNKPTSAVPYPVSLSEIKPLLTKCGFLDPIKTCSVRSSYLGEMYGVLSPMKTT